MNIAPRDKRSLILLMTCALLGATVVPSLFDMFYVLNNIRDNTIAFIDIYVVARRRWF